MSISAKTKMCIIIGDPIEHSLSPVMHNAAYKALGIEDQFVFTAAKIKVEDVKKTIKAVRILGVHGLTCTIPHKIEAIKYIDKIDPIAKKIGAVNTIVNKKGKLIGYNTDWLGAIIPLEKITSLKNKKVALIGAGGAARAIAFGIKNRGAKLKIFNRDVKKAKKLAKDFKADYGSLNEIEDVSDYDIIINSTSVGMKPLEKQSLVPKKYLHKGQIVFDIVYKPKKTKLLKDAERVGAKIIFGIDMLLYQGIAQFEIYTGLEAPEKIMRKSLEDNLKK